MKIIPVNIPIIAAIITAAGSIIGIIFAQHSKVKQEIALRRKIELFDRKQKAYRDILKILAKVNDHSYLIGSEVNWKIIRYVYDEVILIGSKEVVEKTNELLLDTSPDSRGTDEKIKKLWNAIRRDLHIGELSLDQMHMIRPSPDTVTALALYDKHSDTLKSLGLKTPKQISEMDIDAINTKSKIDKSHLETIKSMVIKELEYERDLQRFLDGV